MLKDAVVSHFKTYRYQLWRIWDEKKPMVLFIGLNPSYADEAKEDPTSKKLRAFVESWENGKYGGFYVGNLFALVTPKPIELMKSKNPIGDDNDCHLLEMAKKCEKVICMWGENGILRSRDREVMNMFPILFCLEKSKENHPKHPLYLRADLTPIEYKFT